MAAFRRALSAALMLAPLPALAGPLTDLAAIDTAVAAFTGQQIGVPGGAAQPVDRRLRLAGCSAPLALSWYGNAQTSVLVRCPDAGGWRVFVPVSAARVAPAATPAAIAVARGEGVTVTVAGDGFSVSQPGEALDAGAVGAWIRVRTAAKADPLRARVVRPGLVELPVD
ncbi:flagella basal body P-ring formation protein FlgA [Novosphingobium sp.]|uniref:flagella basal body P-ring formation protein FlgA n=1 Tax=Novosphingobium sp. TaxID=1874826 RepID=UPI002639FE18|nr:flagella basal body P-ring formation protein FlgA [Novosphingobium sp.]